VNSDGDVKDIKRVGGTITTSSVIEFYKNLLRSTIFEPTSDGDKPDISTGTVTFRLNPR
jgi:periplasmic protein TonB